jgi:hypothetical protein
MKWQDEAIFQRTAYNSAKAHKYYYVFQAEEGKWKAGRFWFSREIDYRLSFKSAEQARAYCEKQDREALVIEEVRAN